MPRYTERGEKLPYIVSHGEVQRDSSGAERPGPVGLDPGLNLEQALAVACNLLAQHQSNVRIRDGKGNEISGADLAACCRGEKTLAADLRAN
jgi:hypothetical protein